MALAKTVGSKLDDKTKVKKLDDMQRFNTIYSEVRHHINPETGNNKLEKSHIMTMVNTILRRRQFRMSNLEMLMTSRSFFNFICKRRCCTKDHESSNRRQALITKAKEMLSKKLDVLELIK